MPLSILNNVSDLTAENALSNTQAHLQKTLTELSTGLKINTGSDDAAGLSIANGITANIAALTQSQQNASNGVGLLQTADGALSQVTTLLNRAVTIATEGGTGGITSNQSAALNTEFTSILSEVNQIGQTTNFNGQNVFSSNAPSTFTSTQASLTTATALTSGSKTTITDSATGGTFVFTAGATSKVSDLQAAIASAATAGTLSAGSALTLTTGVPAGEASITNTGGTGINVTSNDAVLGSFTGTASASSTNTVFISDGSTANSATATEISTSISALSSTTLNLNTNDLTTESNSQTALTAINAAITAVSAQRGVIGASVNRLTAATSVINDEVTNLQSADNSIQNADIGKTVADLTQYNVLESTGISALQQANQAQQAVLKLVQ